jgi:glyoxylase-like metal-dependent hydrolase (beta-lactamase superfamily II)
MADVIQLTFNPFQENTYIVYDDTKACVIIDPGCNSAAEQAKLVQEINRLGLRPERLINTHCHIDHVFGNRFVAETYDLPLEIHAGELPVLESAPQVAAMYNIPYPSKSPQPGAFIEDGQLISFGNTQLEAIFTPGHSPASLSFFCAKDDFLIAGDVLFFESIGRTDLPGGNHQTLLDSIEKRLFPLGDQVIVWSGHGPQTSIGYEKHNNPFLR